MNVWIEPHVEPLHVQQNKLKIIMLSMSRDHNQTNPNVSSHNNYTLSEWLQNTTHINAISSNLTNMKQILQNNVVHFHNFF